MTPRLAEPLHVCSTPREIDARSIVNTARASSIITEAWSRFDSRFFVCKYFVVRLSTTKTTKILPLEKYPLYGMYTRVHYNAMFCDMQSNHYSMRCALFKESLSLNSANAKISLHGGFTGASGVMNTHRS